MTPDNGSTEIWLGTHKILVYMFKDFMEIERQDELKQII